MDWERFRLRQVAGQYLLLRIDQPGIPYTPPWQLNASGYAICSRLMEGLSLEDIAREESASGEVSREEILTDLEAFLGQLERAVGEVADGE